MIAIQKVSERILKTLEVAGWTIETLADAKPEELTKIQGIGPATAWRIIVGARRLDRKRRMDVPVQPDERWLTEWIGNPNEPPPRGLYVAPPAKPEPPWMKDASVEMLESKYLELRPGAEIPAMSVRVKRNWLRKELLELV